MFCDGALFVRCSTLWPAFGRWAISDKAEDLTLIPATVVQRETPAEFLDLTPEFGEDISGIQAVHRVG